MYCVTVAGLLLSTWARPENQASRVRSRVPFALTLGLVENSSLNPLSTLASVACALGRNRTMSVPTVALLARTRKLMYPASTLGLLSLTWVPSLLTVTDVADAAAPAGRDCCRACAPVVDVVTAAAVSANAVTAHSILAIFLTYHLIRRELRRDAQRSPSRRH